MSQPQLRVLRDPDGPASADALALIKQFKMSRKRKFTAAEAQKVIAAFFEAHPAEYEAYLAVRRQRKQDQFENQVRGYVEAASAKRGDRAADANTVRMLTIAAFRMEKASALRMEILAGLSRGISGPHAAVLQKKIDGTFVERGARGLAAAA